MAAATAAGKKKPREKVRSISPARKPADAGFAAWRTWAVLGAVMVGGVVAWKLVGTSYKHDIETICNAEKGSGFGLDHETAKLSGWVRDHLGTPEGNQLYSALGEAKVADRPKTLQDAANGVHVSPCPLAATYAQLAARSDARTDLQHLCSEVTFPKLLASDDPARLTMIEGWIDQNAKSPRTKELGAALMQAPAGPARARVLGDAANQVDVFACANEKTLEKPPPPTPSGEPVVRLFTDLQIIGALREDDVKKALVSVNPSMVACYKDGIGRRPDLAGQVLIKLEFDSTGKVAKDEPGEGAGLPDQPTTLCLAHALRTLKLPPVSGPMASVMVPLELTHAQK